MQKLLAAALVVFTLFAVGVLFILHQQAQNNRYQYHSGNNVIDTRTGAVYAVRYKLDGTSYEELVRGPIK